MDLKISTGKIPRAQKVVMYGLEGIGKTTLAAQTPDPLFIDTEGGTAHMDVKRIDGIDTWEQLLDASGLVHLVLTTKASSAKLFTRQEAEDYRFLLSAAGYDVHIKGGVGHGTKGHRSKNDGQSGNERSNRDKGNGKSSNGRRHHRRNKA